MEMASWRYTNEKLFRAFQRLEKNCFIYRNSDPETFETLKRYRDEVNAALMFNDAELDVNDHWGVAHIVFSSPEPNALRHNFTQTEMRTYILLRQLYDERRITSGESGFVSCTYGEFRIKAVNIFGEEVIVRGKGYGSNADIEKSLSAFKRFSLVDVKTQDQTIIIYPGISFCMNTEEMEALCGSILDSWEKSREQGKSLENPDTEEEAGRNEMEEEPQFYAQISLFDGGGQ